MTISKAQIFNIVLNILGCSTPIENTLNDDNRTILLNNYYELARDYVLRDYDWNFASAFRCLSLCKDNDLTVNYTYCYDYPNDCIFARDVFEKGNYKLQKFEIAALPSGEKIILTNAKNAFLRYTKCVDKELYFTCEFSMALAHYLASLVSNVLSGSIQKGEMAYEKYRKILKHAKVLNASEGVDYLTDDETYLDSRG